jgi:sigma-B regulation protein RsbU (phosphoserine phosphatase)
VVRGIDDEQSRLPLGVSDTADYVQVVYKLEPGDCLAMYTDGFSEAMNEADELYGIDRIWKQMQSNHAGVTEHGKRLLGGVKQFVGTRSQSDDMCLVCFGRA